MTSRLGCPLALRRMLAACAAVVLSGCGLPLEAAPEPVALPPAQTDPPRSAAAGQETISVYLVSGDRLVAVERRIAHRTPDDALEALVAGPTPAEVLAGKRTAVAPQLFTAVTSQTSSKVAVVEATEQLTAVSGENQLLAVAQLVWTVTEVPGIRLVRVTIDGRPVEVPTDRGLVGYPVGRSSYASVRPRTAAAR